MHPFKTLITSFLLIVSNLTPVLARNKLPFNQAFELVYANQADQEDYATLEHVLWEYYQYPLNLNQASREELSLLGLLSETQLNAFFAHLAKNGALVSIYELQTIPEFDLPTIYQLINFVHIPEVYPKHRLALGKLGIKGPQLGYWLSRYERVLETQKGYKINQKKGTIPYAGSPDHIITRIKYNHPQGWGWGIAGRKNPGEAFTWDPTTNRYGFDVWTAYFMIQHKGILKTLVLGDYQIGYGQGLVVNAGFSMDKSSETIPIIRTSNLGIKPHSSLATHGFRGGAATVTWKKFMQTVYYAYNALDATVFRNPNTSELYVKSIQKNLLYRQESEIKKKGSLLEQVIGTTVLYQHKGQGIEIGINGLYHTYDIPIQPDLEKNPWAFTGQDNYNISLFYRYLWHNVHFFGEGGISKSGGKAMLAGLVASLSAILDTSLLVRKYDKAFHSPYGKAFRANTTGNSNEQGLYIGFKLRPIKNLNLHTYYDYFRFPEATQSLPNPSSGYSWLHKATYQISRSIVILAQYQEKNKAKKVPKAQQANQKDKNPFIKKGKKRKLKAQLKHAFSRYLDLSTEGQWSHYQLLDQPTWGYALVQSATYKLRKLNMTGQIAWFDANYDNRLFFYEKAAMYSSTMPVPYYQKGIKYYLFLVYKPTPSWRFEAKYAFTWHKDQPSIGSNLEETMGNTRNEIKLQAIYKF